MEVTSSEIMTLSTGTRQHGYLLCSRLDSLIRKLRRLSNKSQYAPECGWLEAMHAYRNSEEATIAPLATLILCRRRDLSP